MGERGSFSLSWDFTQANSGRVGTNSRVRTKNQTAVHTRRSAKVHCREAKPFAQHKETAFRALMNDHRYEHSISPVHYAGFPERCVLTTPHTAL